MNIDEIAHIARLMTEHSLTEFSVESDELKLRLKRAQGAQAGLSAGHSPPAGAQAHRGDALMEEDAAGSASGIDEATYDPDTVVTSPIVGTFYSGPAPDAEDFVAVGDEITEESVVCIIEAMKVMNEIKAEKFGTVKRCLVENATAVEFGQPLFEIEPK